MFRMTRNGVIQDSDSVGRLKSIILSLAVTINTKHQTITVIAMKQYDNLK